MQMHWLGGGKLRALEVLETRAAKLVLLVIILSFYLPKPHGFGICHNASRMRGYAHLDLECKIGAFWSHEFVLISEFIWIMDLYIFGFIRFCTFKCCISKVDCARVYRQTSQKMEHLSFVQKFSMGSSCILNQHAGASELVVHCPEFSISGRRKEKQPFGK